MATESRASRKNCIHGLRSGIDARRSHFYDLRRSRINSPREDQSPVVRIGQSLRNMSCTRVIFPMIQNELSDRACPSTMGNEGHEPRNLHKDVCDASLSIGIADCSVARDDRLSIFRQQLESKHLELESLGEQRYGCRQERYQGSNVTVGGSEQDAGFDDRCQPQHAGRFEHGPGLSDDRRCSSKFCRPSRRLSNGQQLCRC